MRARLSASRSSRSVTRWRKGSAAATALPHGALNALTLPPALRFNQPAAAEAIARFGAAIGSDDPAARVEELARLGGFERLRDLGIPEEAPAEVAEAVAERPGAKANPRPVTPADVEGLLRSIWCPRAAAARAARRSEWAASPRSYPESQADHIGTERQLHELNEHHRGDGADDDGLPVHTLIRVPSAL